MIVTVHEEINIMGAGHHNAAETFSPWTGGPLLRQSVYDWNTRDNA